MYINCHTYYSLRYGTIKPEELLSLAAENKIKTLALTDINNTSACLDFIRTSSKYAIKPVVGVDFRNGADQKFILLAKNNKGFQQINSYLSVFLHSNTLKIPQKPIDIKESYVIYPFEKGKDYDLKANEYLGIKPEHLNKLKFSKWNERLEKLVILRTVSFQNKKGFNTHRLLRAIDNNTLLSRLPESEQGCEVDQLLPIEKLKIIYADYPELIENTQRILDDCHIDFDFSQTVPNNQRSYTGNESLDYRLLKMLTYRGVSYRYQHPGKAIHDRIKKELKIIKGKRICLLLFNQLENSQICPEQKLFLCWKR